MPCFCHWPKLAKLLLICLLAPASSHAQTSAAGAQRSRYQLLRQAAVAAEPSLNRPAKVSEPGQEWPLIDCLDAGLDLGIEVEDPDRPAIQMAMELHQAERSLLALRLPEALWRPTLALLEQQALSYLAAVKQSPRQQAAAEAAAFRDQERLQNAMLAQINQYRRQKNPRAPEVVMAEGCGAGEFPVQIQTRPAGGRVAYITLFRYRLCQAQGLPPEDRNRCRGWVDAVKPTELLSGQYAYRVRWPDGQSSSGVFDTRGIMPTARGDEELVRVLLQR